MIKWLLVGMTSLTLFLCSVCQAGWRSDHERGWHWYERETKENFQSNVKSNPPASYAEQLSSYRKQGEELRAKAVLERTPESVKALMNWEKTMWDNSEQFGSIWQAVLRESPELDYSVTHPTAQYARHLYVDEQKKNIKKSIQNLQKNYGLMFFFKDSCPYCHAMAPIITLFAEHYGFVLHSISLDGGKIRALPNMIKDNGISERFNITMVPAVIAVNPSTGAYFPIATGAISQQEIEERILQIAEYESSQLERSHST
ncbi:MAG: hypothetical protein BGO43_13610 [Gammaproteobacteria bacterium 39-13]|nr:conjugal transfer protein TraF [Gammaproteobacteria bacterium]OJV94783.1 MAG: hypothetical protein BGO43_13610 [Gammaproteobacteria bacterium 39-13]